MKPCMFVIYALNVIVLLFYSVQEYEDHMIDCSHSGYLGLDPWVELSLVFEKLVIHFIQHKTLWFIINIHSYPNSDRNSRPNSSQL